MIKLSLLSFDRESIHKMHYMMYIENSSDRFSLNMSTVMNQLI